MQHSVEEVVLAGGGRGLVIDVPGAKTFSSQLMFNAGSRFTQDENKRETAHIMEHLAFGANAKYPSRQALEEAMAQNGAYRNAMTTYNLIEYIVVCAEFEWERMFEIQLSQVTSPKYLQDEFEAELGNVMTEVNNYSNDYNEVLDGLMSSALGYNSDTTDERLKRVMNVTREDCVKHFERTHSRDNMVFIIAGDMKEKRGRLLEMLETMGLKRGEKLEITRENLRHGGIVMKAKEEAQNMSFGTTLLLLEDLSDEEQFAMSNLNHILSGTFNSRIFGEARMRGLLYWFYSGVNVARYDSSWSLYGTANYDKAEELFRLIAKVMREVREGKITEKEIEDAKHFKLGKSQMREWTPSQLPYFYRQRYLIDGGIDDFWSIDEKIRAVTYGQIMDAVGKFMKTDISVFGVVGDVKREFVDKLGEIIGETK